MKSGTSFAAAIPFVIAVLAIPTGAQTLNVSVEGSGKVTGTGIDCPSDCTENFLPTSIRVPGRPSPPPPTIVLTAAPAAGYQLSSWSGTCQEGLESPTCTVALSGGTTVSATFVATPRAQLTIVFIGSKPQANQTSVILLSSPPIAATTAAGQMNVCTLVADPSGCTYSSPQAGAWQLQVDLPYFGGWGGACSGMGESYGAYGRTCTTSISLGETKTVSAKFAAVGISVVGTGPGKIVVSPPDPFVSAGTVVTFRAEPNAGASFVGWGGGCAGIVPVCTVTADSNNIAVRAQFSDFVSVGVAGSGSVQIVSQAGPSGLSITLVAEPAAGHVFAGWVGGCSGTSSTCTPASGAKVTAIFHPGP